jgi:hypothetical protein
VAVLFVLSVLSRAHIAELQFVMGGQLQEAPVSGATSLLGKKIAY